MTRAIAIVLAGTAMALAPRSAAPIDIPFEFATKQPIISLKVNGGDPLPFVVDTGASIHVIDSGVVQGLAGAGVTRSMRGGGQATVQAEFVEALTLDAGGASWTGQRAALVALGYPKTKHFAGLIGAPILMRYAAQFDFLQKTLRLLDPAVYVAPRGSVQLPFELQEDLPIVHVTIDFGTGPTGPLRLDARLMVDTGASQFIDLNRPFVEAHKLMDAIGTGTDAGAVDRPAGIGGAAPFVYGTARRVVFGGVTYEHPRIGLSRAQSGSSTRADRDGILGNDLLRHFTMTVDYRRKMIVLVNNAEPLPRFRANYSSQINTWALPGL